MIRETRYGEQDGPLCEKHIQGTSKEMGANAVALTPGIPGSKLEMSDPFGFINSESHPRFRDKPQTRNIPYVRIMLGIIAIHRSFCTYVQVVHAHDNVMTVLT